MACCNKCIAVRKVATPLQELACHMGSHSVTCHLAEDIPALTPAEAGTRLCDPGGMQGCVDLVGLLYLIKSVLNTALNSN